jgi:hypothetical protein
LRVDEFLFEVFYRLIIKGKFSFQDAIGYARSAFKKGDDLIYDLDKCHTFASAAGIIGERCGEE